MRIEQMLHFITVYEEKTFIHASDKLHIAQQTLSNSIKSLENELNAKLFIRSHKGVELTPKGEIVYSYFKQFINLYEQFYNIINNTLPTAISISTICGTERNILPDFQCSMFLNYPHIQLNIQQNDLQQVITDVKNHKVDLGIILLLSKDNEVLYPQLTDRSLTITPLRHWHPYVWVGENLPISQEEQLDIDTIRQYPLLLYQQCDPSLKEFYFQNFFGQNITLQYSNNLRSIANLVEATSFLFIDWYSETYGLDFQIYFEGKKVKALPIVFEQTICLDTVAIYCSSQNKNPFLNTAVDILKSCNGTT